MSELYTLDLPTEKLPNFSYETSLDGIEYKFNFKFSVREEAWYLSLYNLAGVLLLSNCRVVPWVNLLLPYIDETLPKGVLTLFPLSSEYPSSPVITLSNLSSDFQLLYLSL